MATGPSTLTPFQATYHWRNKNCYPWAETWFKSNLPGTSTSTSGSDSSSPSCTITEVTSISGDVDLGQRKGKVLTIYDCRIEMKWKGVDEKGEEKEGGLVVPEVSHECVDGTSGYEFEFTSASGPYLAYLRKIFCPILITKLNSFRPALVSTHGGFSASAPEESSPASGSGAATPSTGGYSPAPPGETRAPVSTPKNAVTEEKKASGAGGGKINTASVRVECNLAISGDDMWGLLTDEKKIPMWSRSTAKFSLTPESPFELFGNNVHGTLISFVQGKQIVQRWQLRNPNWPSDHYGTMTIDLNQGSDSTQVTLNLAGVPKGQEDTLRGALETYYVRAFKQMGLVSSSRSSIIENRASDGKEKMAATAKNATTSSRPKSKTSKAKAKAKTTSKEADWGQLAGWAGIAGLGVLLAGIVWSSYPTTRGT